MSIATVPPPVVYLICGALGILLDRWLPTVDFPVWVGVSGAIALVGSLVIMPFVLSRFRAAKTPFDVRKAPEGLVTSGPFRFSRNPSYVALTMLYVGIGLVAGSIGMLVMAVVPVFVLSRWVIPLEECHLELVFGDAYREYRQRVRRWL